MRRGTPPFTLGSLISDSLQRLNLESRVKEHTSLVVWDEVVGEQVAGAAQPEFVRDGQLYVTTKSAVWANELTFYKPDIVSRLNERIGAPAIRDIIFKTGRVRARQRTAPAGKSEEQELEGIQLTESELEEAGAVAGAAGAASPELESLMVTALRLEKWKQAQGWKLCKRCGALQNAASGICPPCRIQP